MWVIAGVLLGLVVLAALVGFHSGPHAHVVAGVIGLLAAAWLVLMAVDGRSAPVLWALLSADVVASAGVGVMAWKGLTGAHAAADALGSVKGKEGIALSDLTPDGIVRVRGEQWSATSVNGTVRAGTRVQVLRATGVHLEVWGEDTEPESVEPMSVEGMFSLDEGESKELNT
ncbi:MAG TPA: NfeD family protein [Acidimicrobiales bacterium]|nr:NfeD family protein [Acidimicrobiales bacterium]